MVDKSEAYNRAILIEKQLAREILQFQTPAGSRFQQTTASKPWQQSWPSKGGKDTGNSTSAAMKPAAPGKPNASNLSFKCYKCGEQGHKANECRKSSVQTRHKALILEVSKEEEQCLENQEVEEIGRDSDGEEGLALVTKKILLALKQ